MRLLALRTILVASDLTSTSDGAVRTALDLSRASGAVLHVVHVMPGTDDRLADDRLRADHLSRIEVELQGIGAREGDFASHIATGDPRSSIGEEAAKLNADVVILGRSRTNALVMHDR